MRGRRGRDQGWGFTSGGKVPEMNERILARSLQKIGLCAGWRALCEAGIESCLGPGIAEKQMFDDLLDAPFPRTRGRSELSLTSVESVEARCDLALKLMESCVHNDRITLHRRRLKRLSVQTLG